MCIQGWLYDLRSDKAQITAVAYPGGCLGAQAPPLFSCIIYKFIKLDNFVNIKKLNYLLKGLKVLASDGLAPPLKISGYAPGSLETRINWRTNSP